MAALLQYAAAVFALRVLRITGKDAAWLLIAAVAFLMAVHRSVVLYRCVSLDQAYPPDLAAECVGLAISVLMLVGVLRIGPFFLSFLRSKEELRKRSDDLANRVKELNCLYKMADLVGGPKVSLEQVIQGTADLIPPAWQYSELACARITLEGQVITTDNFEETPWKLSHDVVAHGNRVGAVEVCYREKPSEEGERVFPKEERYLLKVIADRLGGMIERVRTEEDKEALQEQLHQAHKMEAVGQLAAGVAHDFSNWNTVIRGHVDRACTVLADRDEARKELALVQEAIQEAADLAWALLTFSRKLPTQKKLVDLCAVVEESERLLRSVLPAAINVEVDVACRAPLWVRGDQTQIHQVILNLAINAHDAMPDGGTLRLVLSSTLESDTGDLVEASASRRSFACLVIADTGLGMPPEIQTRIFEPFYTTKDRNQRTGLGLSTVHGIVRDHGGHIGVRSEVGKGSTFTVLLPCIRSGGIAEPVTATTITRKGNGELILLAEDDQHVRAIIASTLESLGYDVTLADDTSTILEAFARHRNEVRLLILDADIPEESRAECLRKLRETGVMAPAIIVTGDANVDSSRLDNRTVALHKPFGMPELASVVAQALGGDITRETGR